MPFDYSCLKKTDQNPYSVLFNYLITDDFDTVRQLTGFEIQDTEELLFKIARLVGDPEFRKAHDVDELVGVCIVNVCQHKLKWELECEMADCLEYETKFDNVLFIQSLNKTK